jgi:hypothetical protein
MLNALLFPIPDLLYIREERRREGRIMSLWRIALAGTVLTFIALQVLGPLTPHIGRQERSRRP